MPHHELIIYYWDKGQDVTGYAIEGQANFNDFTSPDPISSANWGYTKESEISPELGDYFEAEVAVGRRNAVTGRSEEFFRYSSGGSGAGGIKTDFSFTPSSEVPDSSFRSYDFVTDSLGTSFIDFTVYGTSGVAGAAQFFICKSGF